MLQRFVLGQHKVEGVRQVCRDSPKGVFNGMPADRRRKTTTLGSPGPVFLATPLSRFIEGILLAHSSRFGAPGVVRPTYLLRASQTAEHLAIPVAASQPTGATAQSRSLDLATSIGLSSRSDPNWRLGLDRRTSDVPVAMAADAPELQLPSIVRASDPGCHEEKRVELVPPCRGPAPRSAPNLLRKCRPRPSRSHRRRSVWRWEVVRRPVLEGEFDRVCCRKFPLNTCLVRRLDYTQSDSLFWWTL